MKLSKNRLIKIRNTRNQTKKKYKKKKRKHNHKRPRRSFRKNRFNLAKNTVKRRHKQRGGGDKLFKTIKGSLDELTGEIKNIIDNNKEQRVKSMDGEAERKDADEEKKVQPNVGRFQAIGNKGNSNIINYLIINDTYYKKWLDNPTPINEFLFEKSPYLAITKSDNSGINSFVKGINDSIRILTRDEGGEGKADHVVDYDEENINLLWSELSENYTKLDYGEIISRLLFISKFKSDDDPIKHLYNFVNGDNNFNKMYKIDEPKIMKKLNEIIDEIVELPKNIRQKQEEEEQKRQEDSAATRLQTIMRGKAARRRMAARRAEAAREEERKQQEAALKKRQDFEKLLKGLSDRELDEFNKNEMKKQNPDGDKLTSLLKEKSERVAASEKDKENLMGKSAIDMRNMGGENGEEGKQRGVMPQSIGQLVERAKKRKKDEEAALAAKNAAALEAAKQAAALPSLEKINEEEEKKWMDEDKVEEKLGGAKKPTLAVNKGKLRILLKSFIKSFKKSPLVLELPIKISDNLYINISFELDKNGLTVVEKKDERKWNPFKKRFYFKERGKCKEISLNKIFKSFYKFKDKIAIINDLQEYDQKKVYTDKKCTNPYINEEKQQPRPEKQPDIPSNKDIIYEMFTEYYNKLLRNYKQLVDYRNSGEDDTEKLANIILQIQNEIPSIEKNDDIKNIIMGFEQGGDLREEPNITNLIEPALSKLEEISEEICKKFSRLTENKELERLGKIKRKFRNQCPADSLIGKVERFKELNNILEKSVIKESDKILRSADSGATEGGGKEPSKLLSLMNASEEELDNYKNVLGTAGPHPLPQPPYPEEKGNDEDTGDKKAKDKQRGDYVIIDKEAFETLWLQYRAPQKRDDIKIYGKKSWGKLANTVKEKLTSKNAPAMEDEKYEEVSQGKDADAGEQEDKEKEKIKELAKALRTWGNEVGTLEIDDVKDMVPKTIDKQMLYLIQNINAGDNESNNPSLTKLYNCAPYVRTFFSDPELWKKRTKQLIGIFGLAYVKELSMELIQRKPDDGIRVRTGRVSQEYDAGSISPSDAIYRKEATELLQQGDVQALDPNGKPYEGDVTLLRFSGVRHSAAGTASRFNIPGYEVGNDGGDLGSDYRDPRGETKGVLTSRPGMYSPGFPQQPVGRMPHSNDDIRVSPGRVGPGRVGPGRVSQEDDLKLLMAIVRTYVKEDTLALGAIIIERYPEYHSIKKWLANKFKNKWGPMVATIIASTGLNVGASSLLVLATSLTAVGGTVAGILGAAGLAALSPFAAGAGLAYGIGHLTNKTYSSFKKHFGGSSTSQVLPKIKFTAETVCDEECQKSAEETQVMTQITKPIRDPSSGIIIGYSTDIAVTNDGITPRNMIIALKDKKKYFNNRDGGNEEKEGEPEIIVAGVAVPMDEKSFGDEESPWRSVISQGAYRGPSPEDVKAIREMVEQERETKLEQEGENNLKIFDENGKPISIEQFRKIQQDKDLVPVKGLLGNWKEGGGRKDATCEKTSEGVPRTKDKCTVNVPGGLRCKWVESTNGKGKCVDADQPAKQPKKAAPAATTTATTTTATAQPEATYVIYTNKEQDEFYLAKLMHNTKEQAGGGDDIIVIFKDPSGHEYTVNLGADKQDASKEDDKKYYETLGMNPQCKNYSSKCIDSSCTFIDSSYCKADISCNERAVITSYRKMSLKTHPDKGGDVNTFIKVGEAGEVLKEGCKRKLYDEGKYDELEKMEEEERNKGKEDGNVGMQSQRGGKRTRRKKRHRKKRTSRTTRKLR